MSSVEETIMNLLKERQVPHEVLDHPAVTNNAAMAEALKVPPADTVKNLMLETTEGEIILVVLPGDQRFDSKRLTAKAGTKRVVFAKPDKVLEFAGCEVGCVPPFGHAKPVRVFLDSALLSKGQVYFMPGMFTKSVKLEAARLPELGTMIQF
ncbi:MAG: YbaK/EbsC family protein [Verrucomicrobia bacterium]|nr:YbaK/EbsC family protein [Verrucomicrobiota bacterium]MBU4430274.1 YbaK/EbsC family protein [Verrucomicrobiota bacterium]MBU4496459.1 YbaK/EbsC family protein [Verrucomicrobiota bacterium]MCG2679671.1 YbaK/EbsC family protein [Kiritimatiellia bacterium]